MSNWRDGRRYQHLDSLCSAKFLKACERSDFIARHSWCPLIFYEKKSKRFIKLEKKTAYKLRPIMYASHRDAAVFGRYADQLSSRLERFYAENDLNECVIAYRKLGLANYHFAAEVNKFVRASLPCAVLCFDVSRFFDTLNHKYLKMQIKNLLDVDELPGDWYAVFKALTKFRFVKKDDLLAIPRFATIMRAGFPKRIAQIQDVVRAGVSIHKHKEHRGIPQGTPISAAASNVYMMQFDVSIRKFASDIAGMYRRYSDDILLVVPIEYRKEAEKVVLKALEDVLLEGNSDKFASNEINSVDDIKYQYLGFDISKQGAAIRGSSLSRQGRKIKYGLKKTQKDGKKAIAMGKASKIFTKRLRSRFTNPQGRNFPHYSRRASQAFGTKRIARQALKLEKRADRHIRDL